MRRRDFIKTGAAGSLVLLLPKTLAAGVRSVPDVRSLTDFALDSARSEGATYADIRIARTRIQSVRTREKRVTGAADDESYGFGLRVIVNGAWGFAGANIVTEEAIRAAARVAANIARANAKLRNEPVRLAPVKSFVTTWKTPIRRDPFDIPLREKVDRLLSINEEALKVKGVTFCTSSMSFVKEHKYFASTEGSFIEQEIHRCEPSFTVTAVDRQKGGFESRNSYAEPMGMGYEYVEEYPWIDDVRQAGNDAVEKLSAASVDPGKRDLILHPSNLWLTIHESVGHPTELDRALGMEANYAGTSFLKTETLGKLKFGSDIVNFVADKTQKTALATCGFDDDGVPTREWYLVKNGLFVDYQITRDQAHLIGRTESYGCSNAESWRDVAFQRMPNVSLQPGKEDLSLDQLIAGTEDAILVKGRGSYSIDHQRYNFQFGGQAFYEIKRGKITRMLKDVAYQARTPEFWNACDAICGMQEYWIGGSFNDGKGEPGQSNAVSHGCAPARFRQINILNTRRQ